VGEDFTDALGVMPKGDLADQILNWLSQRWSEQSPC